MLRRVLDTNYQGQPFIVYTRPEEMEKKIKGIPTFFFTLLKYLSGKVGKPGTPPNLMNL